jgi:hypothetical protein
MEDHKKVFSTQILIEVEVEVVKPHFEVNMEARIVVTQLWPSVRMKFTLPKLGTWSPPGLPKTQSLITRVKTPRIGVFLISLERS